MKILHVVPGFGFGGMEKVICSILNGLPAQLQHTILPLTPHIDARRWLRDREVRMIPFQRPEGMLSYCLALFRILQTERPDVLMTYNWGATDALWLGWLAGISTIFHHEHGFNIDETHRTKVRRDLVRCLVYRLPQKVVVVSRLLERSLKRSYRLRDSQIFFIPNGIDSNCYAPDALGRDRIRKALGLRADHLVMGFSGRLDPVKNFDLMLEIFEACVKQDDRIRLLLIGEGQEKERIISGSQGKGLADKVLLVGPTDTVLPYLQALDVFLLTSYREQMPMSLLEAMSVGIPVVASRVGEIPFMLEDGKGGYLFSLDDDPGLWAEKILRLRDPWIRHDMGVAAREVVKQNFQEQSMVRRYQDLLGLTE